MMRFLRSALLISLFATPLATFAAMPTEGTLVKASQPAVYYVYGGMRYAFPNEAVFRSWYDDFGSVQTISDEALAAFTLGGNVTFRPGTSLVKITTDPKVYAVEGRNLYWVKDEMMAMLVFGANWAQLVNDVPDAFFTDYVIKPEVIGVDKEYTSDVERLAYDVPGRVLEGMDGFHRVETPEELVQSPITSINQVKTTLPVPEGIYIIPNGKSENGYVATADLSYAEIVRLYKTAFKEWDLLYEGRVNAADEESPTFLNFGKSQGGVFTHRSIIIDKSYLEGTTVSFYEQSFLKGDIAYPYGATDYWHVPVDTKAQDEQTVVTAKTAKEIRDWFTQYGPTYGWTAPVPLTDQTIVSVWGEEVSEGEWWDYTDTYVMRRTDGSAAMIFSTDHYSKDYPDLMELTVSRKRTAASASYTLLSARKRDAQRLSHVKTIVRAFESANGDGRSLGGCTPQGSLLNECFIVTDNVMATYIATTTLFDPSGTLKSPPCGAVATAPCNYSIWDDSEKDGTGPLLDDYRIVFWLEASEGDLAPGAHYATQNGIY
jgi:hypothetical protein